MISRRAFFKGIASVVAVAAVLPVALKTRFYGGPSNNGMTSLTLSEIVHNTLRARSGEFADNIMQNNSLFEELSRKS